MTEIGDCAFADCSRLTGDLSIPDSVTSIGDSAFYGCSGLTGVTIGSGVTSIGFQAFHNCSGLTGDLSIPDSVTWIGEFAFVGCSGLTGVTIGSGVTSIGGGAFNGCSGLTKIIVSKANPIYHSDGNCLIETQSKTLILGCMTSIIPNDGSVTSILDSPFWGCSGLTSITIPDHVTSIWKFAFVDCSGLTEIVVSKGNPIYHSDGNCLIETKSKTLILGCMTSIIPNDGSVTSIREYAFSGCSGLTSITIPGGVTSIENYAFNGCSGLTGVTIGSGATDIGNGAFNGCSGLTKIIVSKGNPIYHSDGNCLIETQSKTLILGCMTSIIPNDGSVTSIEMYAFYGCSGLTSITIPDSVTEIGNCAFEDCSGLESVTIGSGVTSIEMYAFKDCSGLNSVTIGNNVTTIGYGAFYNCSGLTNITIPDSVTSIGGGAFKYCSGLESVTIGSGVTSIGDGAFEGCSGLKAVYYKGTPQKWREIAINSNNYYSLANATRYYFSETEPSEEQWTEGENWWHYDDVTGEIVIWEKDA